MFQRTQNVIKFAEIAFPTGFPLGKTPPESFPGPIPASWTDFGTLLFVDFNAVENNLIFIFIHHNMVENNRKRSSNRQNET